MKHAPIQQGNERVFIGGRGIGKTQWLAEKVVAYMRDNPGAEVLWINPLAVNGLTSLKRVVSILKDDEVDLTYYGPVLYMYNGSCIRFIGEKNVGHGKMVDLVVFDNADLMDEDTLYSCIPTAKTYLAAATKPIINTP